MSGPDLSRHPCFNPHVRHTAGRVHLPVAPDCNIKCNYCNRDYDCVNESRPGVTSAILSPLQALHYLEKVLDSRPEIAVAGLAGPGDPFADPIHTLETLALIRERFPRLLLCVSTNGLNLYPYVDDLREIGVSHVTVTINSTDVEVASKIYAWVRRDKQVYRGVSGARVLLESQLAALEALTDAGIAVKVNSILIPGVNELCIPEVARVVGRLGVGTFNCMPMYPIEGTPFGSCGSPSKEVLNAARDAAGRYVSQVTHCTRCRADAVGLLGEDHAAETVERLEQAADWSPEPKTARDCVAIATMEGVLVNAHLGQAPYLAVYRKNEYGAFEFLEKRPTPAPGGGVERWHLLADAMADCGLILTSAVGESPRAVLSDNGIRVVEWNGLVADGLEALARGETPRGLQPRVRCAAGCAGGGEGC